jgi:uncharacterized protein (DUF2267 family)
MTGLEVFDETVQQTNIWLKEVMDEVGPDRKRAYRATRADLHALRDRLVVDEAAHLGAQLPMLLRGIYYEGWKPSAVPTGERSNDAFLQKISDELQDIRPINAQAATEAVFRTLSKHVTQGEIDDVKGMLPEDIREIWPQSTRQEDRS